MEKLDHRFYVEMVSDIVGCDQDLIESAVMIEGDPLTTTDSPKATIAAFDLADIAHTIMAREHYLIDKYSLTIRIQDFVDKVKKVLNRKIL